MTETIAIISVLVFLETVLSIDNALVLAVIARGAPEHLQKKVLLYGMVGAVVFRMTAIFLAQYLTEYTWIKVLGGAYLLYLAIHYFWKGGASDDGKPVKMRGFWHTVLLVELTDIAFAVDSILAAVAMTREYWIIVTAGLIGTFAMRFAASAMIRVLKKFPNMESTAYLLIIIIGAKVLIEAAHIEGVNFHSVTSPWFIAQWSLMGFAILIGFKKPKDLK